MTPLVALDLRNLPLDQIHESSWNPRKHFDTVKLAELAQSIREKGVLEPILVRQNRQGFEVVAGARRLRGARLAQLAAIPAIVRDLTDADAMELAVVENEQREDVNAMEQADGYQLMLKAGKGYTPASLAKRLGKAESFIVRRLKLQGLEATLQDALREGSLSIGHAEALLRLTPALRKQASHPENGVVWTRSPLLEYGQKWTPTADDLRPLSVLEEFIRTKSHFDPTARDGGHLIPAFGQQLELRNETVDDLAAVEEDDDHTSPATVLELTLDPMARSRMGLQGNAPAPLTPSKWKEVRSEANRCAFTRRGVITHGTQRYGHILNVCTRKSCPKHWPVKKATKSAAGAATPKRASADAYEAEQRRDEAKRRANEALFSAALPLLAKHTAKAKFGKALVLMVLDSHQIDDVEKNFGVALTEKTAAQVLLLSSVSLNSWYPVSFRTFCKDVKFNLAPVEAQLKKQQRQAAKPAKPSNGEEA